MKPHKAIRTARTCLILSALLLSLTACSTPAVGHTPPATESSAPTDSSDALRTYYEALITELKQELLDLKQTDYVARLEYESRIEELEARLNAMKEPPADSDIFVSGDPDPIPPADTVTRETTPAGRPATTSFHYAIENGCAVIYEYLGTARAVTVPSAIVGYPVTRIADEAFKGTAVTSVIVPDTVTEIGWFAFADCTSLTSVTLPASVASIGYGAFDGCPNLTVYCPKDSYAAQFAISFGLRVRYL